MIPTDKAEQAQLRYEVREIPYGSPWFDMGTAEEVLSRVGATRKGKKRDRFIADAAGMFVIRLGFSFYAVNAFEFADVVGRAMTTAPLSLQARQRLANAVCDPHFTG